MEEFQKKSCGIPTYDKRNFIHKFHPYSILTGEVTVKWLMYQVLRAFNSLQDAFYYGLMTFFAFFSRICTYKNEAKCGPLAPKKKEEVVIKVKQCDRRACQLPYCYCSRNGDESPETNRHSEPKLKIPFGNYWVNPRPAQQSTLQLFEHLHFHKRANISGYGRPIFQTTLLAKDINFLI